MEIRVILLMWIGCFSRKHGPVISSHAGVDIGHSCTNDAECTAGNGGEYSKCNKLLSICICTINHLGEDKCRDDSDRFNGVSRRQMIYEKRDQCTLECSPKGTRKQRKNEDWYGKLGDHFGLFIYDKKTSACYDPRRAFNSAPDGFEIKQSTLPNAGLGAFTNIYIEQNTVMGPYKGIFDPDPDEALVSGYSWRIDEREGEDRADIVWVDAKDVTQSNWLRYACTPNSASMENLVAIQYKGEMYYQAFKHIQPGTELLVWYGDSYGEFLGIEEFDRPRYDNAKPGYVGGHCDIDDEGVTCEHDDNTVCADQTCFCIPGAHIRAGICITDETLGGICTGCNGDTCKQDMNAECQKGVCVCKINTIPANGICIPDETFGGRCAARNGERCLLDNNTVCVNSFCRCRYGSTGINGKCMKDEEYQGRCIGNEDECVNDNNAECIDEICVCKENATAVNGKCELDGLLNGKCLEGRCIGENVICDSKTNTCICHPSHFSHDGNCVEAHDPSLSK